MRVCLKCGKQAAAHHFNSRLCYCKNELCPMFRKNQYGKKAAEKRLVRRSGKINTEKGTKELSQMIADVLAHYEFKREMRKAQKIAIINTPELLAS